MKDALLLLDAHYLCHRAFHSTGGLRNGSDATGVIFGFLKSITGYKDEFDTDRIAFCFDGNNLLRRRLYPDYKMNRPQPKDSREKEARTELTKQIHKLRDTYLHKIGFRNIFCYDAYEADDIIATLALEHSGKGEEVVIVSADSDLYQCLHPGVTLYHPVKQMKFDKIWFRNHYGIPYQDWAMVKAIGGCHSDNIRGVHGIGEGTAIKYLKGELSDRSAAFQKIVSKIGMAARANCLSIVELPMRGCPVPTIKKDKITKEKWQKVCGLLGMRSIAGKPPVLTRNMGLVDIARKHERKS